MHERECNACSRRPRRVHGTVIARAVEGPMGGVVGYCWLGDEGGVSGRPLARLQALACGQRLGLQRRALGRLQREREGVVR
jgi:hypothetical protein